ncbi:C3a anaphylatoxin chemotactic receptor-like [Bufo bufo]|uniref:C3a anaphylatoxin chemotactic receptor-like n=1 Tax=Bufo bufo TaxID=8384 RepID=UPI001ABED0E3|nr:C3a anaphylatoxin chemotactic receptor-like [Bufo bufo]
MEDYEVIDLSFTEETWKTELELHMKLLHYFDISRIVVFTITAIVGIIGNGLVIWITGFKMKSVSSVWFLNLAVADFISCLFLFLYVAEWSSPILETQSLTLCLIRFFMLSLNMLTSVYFLMVISLDRCVSTMWPLWTRIHRKIKLARLISGIIWVFCLVSGFLYEAYHLEGLFEYECIVKRYLIGSDYLEQPREKHITRIIVMFALPFTIILVSYSLVAFKIRARKRWQKSNRPFKVILALVICFFVCWFPFHMTSVTPNIDKTDASPWKNVLKEEICLCLAYFNSCLNPIIYVLLSSDVKGLTLRHKMESAMTAQYDLDDDEEIPNRTERARKEDSSAL